MLEEVPPAADGAERDDEADRGADDDRDAEDRDAEADRAVADRLDPVDRVEVLPDGARPEVRAREDAVLRVAMGGG